MSKKNRSSKRAAQEVTPEVAKPKDKSPYVFQREKLKQPLEIHMRYDLSEKQQAFVDKALDKETRLILCDGIWGTAKAQPLDAKVLTHNGWKLMGEIKTGDKVIAGDGKPTNVLGVFPQGEKDIYQVTFSDGSKTECCLDHLWLTQTEFERNRHRRKRNTGNPIYTKTPIEPSVRSLQQIKDTLLVSGDHLNHSIPIVRPIAFEESAHYIDPYVLGALIGDGCLRQRIVLSSVDPEIIQRITTLLPSDVRMTKIPSAKIEYSITRADGSKGMYRPNPFKEELIRLGVMGKISYEKSIPKGYLMDSVPNRIKLLQGLMDTDGTTTESHTSFCTTSRQLASDVQFLVQSLGGTACCATSKGGTYPYKGERRTGRVSYRVSVKLPNDICPFSLSRKRERLQLRTKYFPIRYFKSVELIGRKQAQCILVEHPDHLYVTDDCIVTHNTYLAVYSALRLLSDKRCDSLIYLRAPIEAGKSIGFLPGGSDEKINPYAEPLFQKLHELLDDQSIKTLENDKRIEVVPPGFMRGQSWNCKAIIVDEAANFDRAMLELILSRVGPFCKVFIIGSQHQSDIENPYGFTGLFRAFDDDESRENGVHCFYFNEEADIVRSKFIKFVMRKLGVLKVPEPIGAAGDWVPTEKR